MKSNDGERKIMTKHKPIKANASIKKERLVKKTNAQWDEYFNTISFQLAPASGDFKKRMGIELVEWARLNPQALRITQFFNGKGIHIATWYDWIDKDENLKKMHKMALSMIADRREIGALNRTLDATMVKHTMAMFDEDWKKHEEWRARLSDTQANNTGTKIVVIEKFGLEEK